MSKKIVCISIVLLFLFQLSNGQKQFKKYSYAISIIDFSTKLQKALGTGFFFKLDTNYFFVTALHVVKSINLTTMRMVDNPNNPKVITVTSEKIDDGAIGAQFPLYDSALRPLYKPVFQKMLFPKIDDDSACFDVVILPISSSHKKNFNFLTVDNLDTAYWSPNDSIYCYGFPETGFLKTYFTKGIVFELDRQNPTIMLFGKMKANPGYSGSPLFIKRDKTYRLTGIVSLGDTKTREYINGVNILIALSGMQHYISN